MAYCACCTIGIVDECSSMSDHFSLSCIYHTSQFYRCTQFSYFIIQIAWSSASKLKTKGISLEKFCPWKFDIGGFQPLCCPSPLPAALGSSQYCPSPSLAVSVRSRSLQGTGDSVCRFCVALTWGGSASGRPLQGLPVRLCKRTLIQCLETELFLVTSVN